MAVFITLAVAAFLTAFYTMRQITLTFLGGPRTEEATHAQETPWTMTVPLVVLAVFAIGFGWVGIPEHFPLLGGLIPNWFHEFVGSTLAVLPEAAPFSWVPLLTSLTVALGGLLIGWLAYRNVAAAEQAHEVGQRVAGVHDVLDDQHVAALERRVEVLEDAHDARGIGLRAVAGDRHEVDLAGDRDAAHQVGEEDHGALQDADHEEVATRVVAADPLPQLADAAPQLVAGDEGLPDRLVFHRPRG